MYFPVLQDGQQNTARRGEVSEHNNAAQGGVQSQGGVARRSGCFWFTEEAGPAKRIHHFKVWKNKQDSAVSRALCVQMDVESDVGRHPQGRGGQAVA